MYCVAPLPLTEVSERLRKPVLRSPEKHQLGYNIILLPQHQVPSQEVIDQAAELLKLSAGKLLEITSEGTALPVARTASREEAELVFNRLQDLELSCLNLGDQDLGLTENTVKRVKSMAFADDYLTIQLAGVAEETVVAWTDIVLILPARLIETRVEISERMTRKPEKEILDYS